MHSADGKFMASGTRDGRIQLWDAARGDSLRTLSGASGEVGALAFSPDGTILAGGGYDKTVRLWDVATGARIHEMAGAPYALSALAFSPDGRPLASAGLSQPVRIWEVRSGKLLSTLPTDMYTINIRVGSLAFSPDGNALAAGIAPLLDGTGGMVVWEVAGGRVLHRLTGADSVEALTFSADGRLIFGGGDDESAHAF